MFTKSLKLIVGDWSSDGHGKSDKFYFKVTSSTSLDEKVLTKLLKDSQEEFSFSLSLYCSDYEDSSIPKNIIEPILLKLGYPNDVENPYIYVEGDEDEEDYSVKGSEAWVTLIVDMMKYTAKKQNLDIEFELVEPEVVFDIGGYGLFYG